jgi:hypothetical protein
MIVAIGVVGLLTIGVGQIFRSVSTLVSTGAGVAETDQLARTIDRQIRQDLEDLSRLPAGETFLVIRQTRLGDLDYDGNGDEDGEVGDVHDDGDGLYLTQRDLEADTNADVVPYTRNDQGVELSRAVTVRLDEMMFLTRAPQGHESFQHDIPRDVSSPFALIYYGHGLRPPLDPDYDDPDTEAPRRMNYADGWFGAGFGGDNPFHPTTTGNSATGRNQFASDFILCRRPVLLMGYEAAGYACANPNTPESSSIGRDGEFAPSPIDVFSEERLSPFFGGTFESDDVPWTSSNDRGYGAYGPEAPNPRLLRHGRTDVIALGAASDLGAAAHLRAWLQGTRSYFETGACVYAIQLARHLWQRSPWAAESQKGPLDGSFNGLQNDYLENLRLQQTALAAMLNRPLVDPEPPLLRLDPDLDDAPSAENAFDARMDLHAILAESCSSFEIAWSGGQRWQFEENIEFDRDRDPETGVNGREYVIRQGDLVWFDMDFTFHNFWREAKAAVNGLDDPEFFALYPRPSPDPEIGENTARGQTMFDFMPGDDPVNTLPAAYNRTRNEALHLGAYNQQSIDVAQHPTYSTLATGGRDFDNDADYEYLAVWGFQEPAGTELDGDFSRAVVGDVGTYGRAWTKPHLLRVRVTLHDSQDRLVDGKTYEFIYRLNLTE